MPRPRNQEINRRRQRKARVAKLKEKLANTKDLKERDHIIEQIKKRVPYYKPPKK